MGCRSICRRSVGVQEIDLRNALRSRQCGVCAVRPILRRRALSGIGFGEIAERRTAAEVVTAFATETEPFLKSPFSVTPCLRDNPIKTLENSWQRWDSSNIKT